MQTRADFHCFFEGNLGADCRRPAAPPEDRRPSGKPAALRASPGIWPGGPPGWAGVRRPRGDPPYSVPSRQRCAGAARGRGAGAHFSAHGQATANRTSRFCATSNPLLRLSTEGGATRPPPRLACPRPFSVLSPPSSGPEDQGLPPMAPPARPDPNGQRGPDPDLSAQRFPGSAPRHGSGPSRLAFLTLSL